MSERMLELLAGRALRDASDDEHRELERLLAAAPAGAEDDGLALELAAARADLAYGPMRFAPLPGALAARLRAEGEAAVAARRPRAAGRPAPAPAATHARTQDLRRPQALPWLVAAAALVLALLGWLRAGRDAPTLVPSAARATLVAAADDLLDLPWKTAGELADSDASGDVVWSDARQEGYMRFRGLSRNDPTAEQYQLWIFDREQSLDTPVDGGVFDVDASGELVVPIDAKLAVHEAIAFAVTVEKPGGVVVSDRTRLILTAGL